MSNSMCRCLYAAVLAVVAGACWDLANEDALSSSRWAGTVVLMMIVVATGVDLLARVLREDHAARIDAERCREQRAHRWADRVLEETDALLIMLTASGHWRESELVDASMREPHRPRDGELVCLQQKRAGFDGRRPGVARRDDAARRGAYRERKPFP